MANYTIMKCANLKTLGSVAASFQHNFKERETLNADAIKTPNNEILITSTTDKKMRILQERLPKKSRKGAYKFSTWKTLLRNPYSIFVKMYDNKQKSKDGRIGNLYNKLPYSSVFFWYGLDLETGSSTVKKWRRAHVGSTQVQPYAIKCRDLSPYS